MRTGVQSGTAYVFVTQSTGPASGNILQFAVPPASPRPGRLRVRERRRSSCASSASGNGPADHRHAGGPRGRASRGGHPGGGLRRRGRRLQPDRWPRPLYRPRRRRRRTPGRARQHRRADLHRHRHARARRRQLPRHAEHRAAVPRLPGEPRPAHDCGASGPAKNQFAIMQSIANGVDDVPGIVVQSEASPADLIPGTTDLAALSRARWSAGRRAWARTRG